MQVQVRVDHDLLNAYAERLARLKYSPHTGKAYLRAIRNLLKTYPHVAFDAFTPEHIERHLDARRLSPRSFSTEFENLRGFFTWLHRQQRLIRVNPCDGVERPHWRPKRRPAPTWEEFRAVRDRCRVLEEAALVEILYFTGLRVSELRSVRVGHVDLRRRRMWVMGKGDRERTVVFPERTAAVLRLHLWRTGTLHPEAFLFRGIKGPRDAKVLRRILLRLGREAELSYRLTPHILRHGFFRLCKVRGVPLEVAAELGGHVSIRTTADIYGQMDADELQTAYDRSITGY